MEKHIKAKSYAGFHPNSILGVLSIIAILLWIACTQASAHENPNKQKNHQKLPGTPKIKLTAPA